MVVEKEVEKVVVVTPTAAPAAEVKVNPGKVTIMIGDFGTERFDPAFNVATGHTFGRNIGGFLISGNEKGEMVPGIATKWDISEDGRAWTFTIRKGVKFHDGSDVTPEDVRWTLDHNFGPQALEWTTSSTSQGLSRRMNGVELAGPDKVTLAGKEPIVELAWYMSEVGPTWIHVIPGRANLHDSEEEVAYDKKPIGAGPMMLEKHVDSYKMTLQRFDDFYYQPANGLPEDKRVNFQSLDIFLVPEEATRVAAIRAGEADIAPVSVSAGKQLEAGGGRMVFGPEGLGVEFRLHGCYESKYPCYDKRVRHAMDYAIDKELIRDTLYGGPEVFQLKGHHLVTSSTMGYTPSLDPWPSDPDKARQLMADAGYPGGKGFGKYVLNTWPSTAMPLQVEAAQLVADMWHRELGLDVEVRVGNVAGIKQKERNYELNGQAMYRENETRSDATSVIMTSYGSPDVHRRLHEDPELFRFVQETAGIVDTDQRAEALKELYLRLRDETYLIGVGYINIPWGVGPGVLSWQPYSLSPFPSVLHTLTLK